MQGLWRRAAIRESGCALGKDGLVERLLGVKALRRIFRERARVVIYVESEDMDRMLQTARGEGKTLLEWARETLLGEISNNADVPRSRKVRGVGRGGNAHEYATYVAAQLEASVNPERDPVPDIEESRARKSEKTCPHGYAVGWRCTLCGGVVK